jgi:transmembrane protein EpsG
MTVFYITLTAVYLFSLLARCFSNPTKINTCAFPNRLLVFLALVPLVLVAGLRNNIGDTFFYMHSYAVRKLSWEDIDYSGDFGFNIYQMLLQQISTDPQLLIFSTALITNVLIVIVLYKYSRLLELSLYVYITAGSYLVSMNGIRQFLAASIIFMGTNYIMKGSFKKYALLILFASTIHKSALILLPVYFIIRRKAWTKNTFLLILSTIVIVLGFNLFSSILFSVIEDTQYSHYSGFAEGGANILRVIVSAVPILLAYLGRDKFREVFPKSDYIVNLSLISLLFMIIATQNWIFARFTIYFGLYNLILISWVVQLFTKKDQKLIYLSILVFYFIFFFYEQVLGMGIIYESDFLDNK